MMRGFFSCWVKLATYTLLDFDLYWDNFIRIVDHQLNFLAFFMSCNFLPTCLIIRGGFERTPLIISVVIPSTEIWNNWYSAQVRAIALRYITLMISRHQPETKFRQTHTDRTFMNISLLNRLHLSLITSIMTLKLNCQPSLLFIVMI